MMPMTILWGGKLETIDRFDCPSSTPPITKRDFLQYNFQVQVNAERKTLKIVPREKPVILKFGNEIIRPFRSIVRIVQTIKISPLFGSKISVLNHLKF